MSLVNLLVLYTTDTNYYLLNAPGRCCHAFHNAINTLQQVREDHRVREAAIHFSIEAFLPVALDDMYRLYLATCLVLFPCRIALVKVHLITIQLGAISYYSQ